MRIIAAPADAVVVIVAGTSTKVRQDPVHGSTADICAKDLRIQRIGLPRPILPNKLLCKFRREPHV